MSRVLWVGVGAVGGIYTYRKGQQAWDTAKERGVSGNATLVASAASSLITQIRANNAANEMHHVPEMSTARVIDITDAAMDGRRSAIRLAPTEVGNNARHDGDQSRGFRARSSRRRTAATMG